MKLIKSTFLLGCLVGGMAAAVAPLLLTASRADTRLLPFQGRLTDATGAAIPDGAKVVEFKIYDAPTGGNVKWAGEVHKLSVNGGLVNTMLGSKASLGSVDFSTPTYLQITIDGNNDNQITMADPPLLPRQTVMPAVFAVEAGNARDSVKLAGADWSAVLVNAGGVAANEPLTGYLNGGKIRDGSIDGAKLAAGSVNGGAAGLIADGSLTKEDLANDSVESAEIKNGSIQPEDLSIGLQNSVTPVGAVIAYAGPAALTAPSGWELCDGRAVGRADPKYVGLYNVLRESHGRGDGTATFNLPDYRGRFLRGVDDADGLAGEPAAERDPEVAERTALGSGTPGSVGSVQDDAFQTHNHKVYATASGATATQSVRYIPEIGNLSYYTNDFTRDNAPTDFYAAEELAGAKAKKETRPKNSYVNFLIKL